MKNLNCEKYIEIFFLCKDDLAGVPGFEPGHGGIKTRCLTAWLYPTIYTLAEAMVREARLELAYLAVPEPKSGASTNFATPARLWCGYDGIRTHDLSIMSTAL